MVLDLYWSIVPLYYLITHCSAQTCLALPGSDFNNINISPRPSANDPLTGGDTLGAECGELSNPPNTFQCIVRSPLLPLIDGDLGPEGTNYTNTMVRTWHRSTGTVTIAYTFNNGNGETIRHINLYFYSNTSMAIGLPSVTVYRGSPAQVVEYHIFGNDDITQEDNMRRQIVLSLRSTSSSRLYILQFDFEDTDVDWLVLSETRLCEFPNQDMVPTDPPSLLPVPSPVRASADNLTLSCTVAGEGRFSWQWTDPDGNPPRAVILSNVTRTSTATFTNIRGTGGGILERNLTFTCTATYNPLVSGVERNNISQESHVLLQAIETTSPTPVTTENTNSSTENTTMTTTNGSGSILVIAVAVSLVLILLLLVGVVVVVLLVLWRCRHQHTAKEEASHTSSQTHTHPVVSLCEETGQVQYVSEQRDSPSHTYSSIQNPHERRGTEQEYSTLYRGENQVQRKKKGAKPCQEEEMEMQEYSTVYHSDRPSQTRGSAGKGPENPLSESVYDQIDQPTTGADALDKVMKTKKIKITSSAAPPSTETETPVDQLYAQVNKKKKNKKAKVPTSSPETAVDQLYAQVDKKKKNKKAKEPTSSPETQVDQLYAQVNKKKQKSKEKEVCPEESGAVYSVVNKPSPPQVPTKSQQLLEEIG